MAGGLIQARITGDAGFSDDMRYRHWLTRVLRPHRANEAPYLLWCGFNPGIADAETEEPATKYEWAITQAHDYVMYAKVNCIDYIASQPSKLPRIEESLESSENKRYLKLFASSKRCKGVVLVFGTFPEHLRAHVRAAVEIFKAAKQPLYCIGVNSNGTPRSPLHSPRDAKIVKWKEVLF